MTWRLKYYLNQLFFYIFILVWSNYYKCPYKILGIPKVGEKQWVEKEKRAKVSVNNGQVNRLDKRRKITKHIFVWLTHPGTPKFACSHSCQIFNQLVNKYKKYVLLMNDWTCFSCLTLPWNEAGPTD